MDLVTATLVTLVDGRAVLSDAEEWRNETLARHVLSVRPLDARRAWLADFERQHGPAETEKLRSTMQLVHEKARAA